MADFEVLRGGSASALRVRLPGGGAVKAESGALVSKSQAVELGATMDGAGRGLAGLLGGVLGGAARSCLTGESFFLQTLRCPGAPGEALVAPAEQGDVVVLELGPGGPQEPLPSVLVASGAFLCAEDSVEVQTRAQGLGKGLLSGGGLFLMRCSGRGRLALSCLGSCVKYELGPGEVRQVDNGHLVAWAESVGYAVGMATNSVFGSVASGEGIMCTFTGPGPVWIQTHKPQPGVGANGEKRKTSGQRGGPLDQLLGCCFLCVFLLVLVSMIAVSIYAVATGGHGGSHRHQASGGRRQIDEF